MIGRVNAGGSGLSLITMHKGALFAGSAYSSAVSKADEAGFHLLMLGHAVKPRRQ